MQRHRECNVNGSTSRAILANDAADIVHLLPLTRACYSKLWCKYMADEEQF
jgi:hypothetical protein